MKRLVLGLLASVDEDLRKLSAREEQVLRLLFGVGEVPHSRDELGQRLGVSRDWLRSIERRALRNLRSAAVFDDQRLTPRSSVDWTRKK